MGIAYSEGLNIDIQGLKTAADFSGPQKRWINTTASLGEAGIILTTTPLGANASYTQAAQDRLAPIGTDKPAFPVGRVRGLVWANQPGILYLEESDDNGSTWSITASVTVSANTTTSLPWTALTKRWYRFRYVNGATAQTGFILVQQAGGLEIMGIEVADSTVQDGGSLPGFVIPIAASDGTKVRFLYASPDRRLEVWNRRLDYITFEHDSIDVARMSKGPISIPPVFDAVTTGGTSQEIFCGGFNALLVHHVISGGSTGGYVSLQMSPKSLGTFVAHHGKGQNIKSAATTSSYISLFEAIFDYVKLVLTVTDGTHTVIAQPINL